MRPDGSDGTALEEKKAQTLRGERGQTERDSVWGCGDWTQSVAVYYMKRDRYGHKRSNNKTSDWLDFPYCWTTAFFHEKKSALHITYIQKLNKWWFLIDYSHYLWL